MARVPQVVGLLTIDEKTAASHPYACTFVELRIDGEHTGRADDDVVDVAPTRANRHGVEYRPAAVERIETRRLIEFTEGAEIPRKRILGERRSAEEPRES